MIAEHTLLAQIAEFDVQRKSVGVTFFLFFETAHSLFCKSISRSLHSDKRGGLSSQHKRDIEGLIKALAHSQSEKHNFVIVFY